MRRFPTIFGILLLVGGALAGGWYFFNNQPKVAEEEKPQQVRITNIADNKFAVSWTTKVPTIGEVEYGMVGEKLEAKASDDRGGGTYTTHHITVKDLQPNTQYAFRILSAQARFDNNGSPYTVATGPSITVTPTAQSFYGKVEGKGAEGSIVYLALPSGVPTSTLVNSTGNYTFSISTVRTLDLKKYVEYDKAATIVNISIVDGNGTTTATVNTANSAPVPTISLGKNQDFRETEQPPVAQVEPETPPVFNVEPLNNEVNEVGDGGVGVTIINPDENEVLSTLRPEFRGTGRAGAVLSILVQSAKSQSENVVVLSDGTWSWSPPQDLNEGPATLTITYLNTSGVEQTVERNFSITVPAYGADPAFESSPSASISPLPSPSQTASPYPSLSSSASATPREQIPSTESGVPVTGVFELTLLTGGLGLVIMIVGTLLLVI